MSTLAFLNLPGGWEWIILVVIGLLLFGRRLPEVGRSLGKSIVEFKRGIRDIEEEVDEASRSDSSPSQKQVSQGQGSPALETGAGTGEEEKRTVSREDAVGGTG